MIIQRINIIEIAFVTILVIINLNKATSLRCYECKSIENGECGDTLRDAYLVECTKEEPKITTEDSITKSTDATVGSTSTSMFSSSSSSSSSSSPETSFTNSKSTLALSTTISDTQSRSTSSESISAPSSTVSNTEIISTTPESISATSSTVSNTEIISTSPESTSTLSSASSSPEMTFTPPETSAESPSTTTEANNNPPNNEFIFNGTPLFSKYKRETKFRANDIGFQCMKLIYNENGVSTVQRKCVSKAMNSACDKEKGNHADLSVCEICDNQNGCNSSSNNQFSLISIFLPFIILLYILSK